MRGRHYRKTVVGLGLLALLFVLPLAATAQVEEARARIDGMA